jgi:hypothetical protein
MEATVTDPNPRDDSVATINAILNKYVAGRRALAYRQLLGYTAPWPDRPVGIPADFGELDLAALANQLREAFRAYALEGDPLDDLDESVDELLEAVDDEALAAAREVAVEVLRKVLSHRRRT